MVRTFVAVDLPAGMQDRLRESQEILARSKGRLAIVAPTNLHITLKFLGEVDPAQIEPIVQALRTIAADPFEVTLGCAVCNPPKRPRVVWCDIMDAGKSAELAARVDAALEPLGFPREKRPFRPHVTLTRVKEFDSSLLRQVECTPRDPVGTFTVEKITLKKSSLTPRGSIYEDLAEVAL
ncbi:RNA 2',3'-cyclic phosphodiesterase [Methanoculleus frigidifontis]|nr:RNA 2',3'-cyclic phosphodiesterase [Methanoculleus sp. FWC-SCC1]